MESKPKVLVFTDWYWPAYKAGGPVKSIHNLVGQLHDQVEFSIVTSDRDLGDSIPFSNIKTDAWQQQEGCRVIYLSKSNQTYSSISKLIKDGNWDAIYVNGLFSLKFSIFPHLACLLNKQSDKEILAPRGMLGKGALKIKPFKKNLFLLLMNTFFGYKRVKYHATSKAEMQEIFKEIDQNVKVFNIPNLIAPFPESASVIKPRSGNQLRMVFLSRISRKKNLLYAIESLHHVAESVSLLFDIYGPIDDETYWESCRIKMADLPAHVQINYKGSLMPHQVVPTLSQYQVFLFLSLHENFGHVVVEALQAGLYLFISDQTPWDELEESEVGEIIPLNNQHALGQAVSAFTQLKEGNQLLKNKDYLESKLNLLKMKADYFKLFKNHD